LIRNSYLALLNLTIVLAAQPSGDKLFAERCAVCHNDSNPRAAGLETLRAKSPEAILSVLTVGVMRVQGAKLSGVERRLVAEYITGKKMAGDATGTTKGLCASRPAFPDPAQGPAWNGWGASPANTRFQTAGAAGLTADQVPKLKLKWALGFPDATSAWASPTIAGGRIFVGSQNGTVYSLDAKTGCIYWSFSAAGGVRTAISISPRKGSRNGHAVFFGDTTANLYALDAVTGEKIWTRQLEDHPLARITGAPVLYQDRLYVPMSSYEEAQGASPDYECCTFRGSVSAVDIHTGKVIWKTYTISAIPKPRGKSSAGKTLWGPSGSAIWSAPTVDPRRKRVYAATGNTYSDPEQPSSDAVIAFDMATGKIEWMKQVTPKDVYITGCRPGSTNPNCPENGGPDHDFGNSPILTSVGGKDIIVIGQKSGVGYAMDPDKQGEVLWQYRAGEGGALGGMEWGSAVDADNAYFPVADMGRPKPGGLHAVNLKTGERVWYSPPPPLACGQPGRGCNAAQSAAVTVIPGVVFSGSNDGAIRAYSTRDGSVLWEYNTNREFETLNGVPGKGASMHGPGPTIAGGMMFLNSGYGGFGGRPGNVLLAFGVDE
jgi:polyvinyl alcohol dehydrogenase (cytochrome)